MYWLESEMYITDTFIFYWNWQKNPSNRYTHKHALRFYYIFMKTFFLRITEFCLNYHNSYLNSLSEFGINCGLKYNMH